MKSTTAQKETSIFSTKSALHAFKNREKDYESFIQDVRTDLNDGFQTEIVDPLFLDQLTDIIHDEVFDSFSPLRFYWISLVDDLIYLIQLHDEILSADEYNEDHEDYTELEKELLSYWQNSEFQTAFNEIKSSQIALIEISDQLLPLLENQIISFYVLNINQFRQEFDEAIIYHPIIFRGDSELGFFLGEKQDFAAISNLPESYPSFPVLSFDPDNLKIKYELNETGEDIKLVNNVTYAQIGKKTFTFINSTKLQNQNIINAITDIKKLSQSVFEQILYFQNIFILNNDEEQRYMTHPAMPQYTRLNSDLQENKLRDALILSTAEQIYYSYISFDELTNTYDEIIYYSPWTKKQNPLHESLREFFRELYLLNFYYSMILKKEDQYLNYIFQFKRIEFSYTDLQTAKKFKKYTSAGLYLFSSLENNFNEHLKFFSSINDKKVLAPSSLEQVQKLKDDLTEASSIFSLK
jgi:hypothetical protein